MLVLLVGSLLLAGRPPSEAPAPVGTQPGMDPEAVSALPAGREHVTTFKWPPWTICVRCAPILRNDKSDGLSEASHGRWTRELSLTMFAGQHLPEALFGRNNVELRHDTSGVRISFCALEALRC